MKKFFYSFAAIVALLATSCVKEANSDLLASGEETVVTFDVKATELSTRAADINTGLKATKLLYAIYDTDWKRLQTFEDSFDGVNLTKQITLRLVKNKTYNLVFWAQNPDVTCYTCNWPEQGDPNVVIDYNGLVSNNDKLDAFFGSKLNFQVGTTTDKNVELRRPFAQINFGTNDYKAAKDMGYDLANASVSFTTKAYTKFYLNNGKVDTTTGMTDVTFAGATPIDTDDTTSLSTKTHGDFHWVAMNYILWPNPDVEDDKSMDLSLPVCNITLTMANQAPITIEVPQAPARRNWRTNLVGYLLTQEQSFQIIILPEPEDAYDVEVPNL